MKIRKKAFTLIEVILTIVVIAIAVTAVPSVILQIQKSTDFSIMQEALFATSTKAFSVLSYRWDEYSSDDPDKPLLVQVINTQGHSDLNDTGEGLRIGHIKADGRRKFFTLEDRNATAKADFGIGSESDSDSGYGLYDDFDDFDGQNFALSVVATGSVDYKKDLNISTTVLYINDDANYSEEDVKFTLNQTPTTNTTNIKFLKVNSRVVDKSKTVESEFSLNAFSSNIGETNLYHRIKQ